MKEDKTNKWCTLKDVTIDNPCRYLLHNRVDRNCIMYPHLRPCVIEKLLAQAVDEERKRIIKKLETTPSEGEPMGWVIDVDEAISIVRNEEEK